MERVELYTDGACSGNPGPGGWAAILRYNEHEKVICGKQEKTTNNRMELTAVIEGLRALKRRVRVDVYTDSKYVADAVNKKWVFSWRSKGWKKLTGGSVLNIDLWEELLVQMELHDVRIHWIKGHNDNPFNERCDALAVEMSKKVT